MNLINPFEDCEITATYESWYLTKGKKAAEAEKALLKSFIEQFSRARTILEVGCGTGYFTNWFRTLGLRPVGLDYSRSMIRQAHQNYDPPIIQGDALVLPFQAQTFDLVALITSLEFISSPYQALIEVVRVSRQGLILGVINKHSLLGRRYRRKGGLIWGQARLFSPGELMDLLKKIVPQNTRIILRTTLWPFVPVTSKLHWGGFIGVAVHLQEQEKER